MQSRWHRIAFGCFFNISREAESTVCLVEPHCSSALSASKLLLLFRVSEPHSGGSSWFPWLSTGSWQTSVFLELGTPEEDSAVAFVPVSNSYCKRGWWGLYRRFKWFWGIQATEEHSEQTRRWQCGTLLRQGMQDDVEGYQKMLLCLSRCDVGW